MPTYDSKPPRHHLIIIIIIILGRMAQAVQDADTTMVDVCRKVLSLVDATDKVYATAPSSRSAEQAAVAVEADAFCASLDNGAWPDCTALSGLADNWEKAVQNL